MNLFIEKDNRFKDILVVLLVLMLIGSTLTEMSGIPNWLIASKVHLFNLISLGVILVFLFVYRCDKPLISINYIDLAMIVSCVFVVTQYVLTIGYYNEKVAGMALSTISMLFFKFYITSTRNADLVKTSLIIIIIFSGLFEAVYGQLQLLGIFRSNNNLFAITGSFHNPGPYAIYLSCILVVTIIVLTFDHSQLLFQTFTRILSYLTGFSIIILLPVTQSRSSWLSLIISVLFVLIIKYRQQILAFKKTIKPVYVFFVLFILLLLSCITFYQFYHFKQSSADGRFYIWRVSWEAFLKHPILGISYDQYKFQYGNMHIDYLNSFKPSLEDLDNARFTNYALNDYIQLVVENGIVGLFLLGSIIFLPLATGFKVLLKSTNIFVTIAMGIIFSILTSAMFSYPLQLIPFWLLILISVCLISSEIKEGIYFCISYRRTRFLFTAAFLFAGMFFVAIQENKVIKAKRDWYRAEAFLQTGMASNAVSLFERAHLRFPEHPEILLGYGKALFLTNQIIQSNSILKVASNKIADPYLLCNLGNSYVSLRQYSEAEQCFNRAVKMVPNKMYPKYLLANLYISRGDWKHAQVLAETIIAMKVHYPSKAVTQMVSEMSIFLSKRS